MKKKAARCCASGKLSILCILCVNKPDHHVGLTISVYLSESKLAAVETMRVQRINFAKLTSFKMFSVNFCCNGEPFLLNKLHMFKGFLWFFVFRSIRLEFQLIDGEGEGARPRAAYRCVMAMHY